MFEACRAGILVIPGGKFSGVQLSQFLAVANRKGGVGKSTVAVMLAHALAVWGKKRVLVMDLDSQCNTSYILLGGEGWRQSKNKGTTIADYFYDMFDGQRPAARDYILGGAGDVTDDAGKDPTVSILPGSLLLEDVQGELYLMQAKQGTDPDIVGIRVRQRISELISRFQKDFDIILLDCPPGLSFAALAAIKTADKVIVPFRPDYVSQFAVDRVSMLIEEKGLLDDVFAIPEAKRRYVTLANCVRDGGPDKVMVEELAANHPLFETQLPLKNSISDAFHWSPKKKTMAEKYGDGIETLRALHKEVESLLSAKVEAPAGGDVGGKAA